MGTVQSSDTKNTGWYPVTLKDVLESSPDTKIPEEGSAVLVTICDPNNNRSVVEAQYQPNGEEGELFEQGFRCPYDSDELLANFKENSRIIAWMYLPEPYMQ